MTLHDRFKMTTRESYGISKVLIDNLLPLLATNPSEAMKYFAIDAKLLFSQSNETDIQPIIGKHSIYDFLQTLPLFRTEVTSYDTHSITGYPPITVSVITGRIFFGPSTSMRMHLTFHVEERNGGRSALIRVMSFKIFEN